MGETRFGPIATAAVTVLAVILIIGGVVLAIEKYHNRPMRIQYEADCKKAGGEPHFLRSDWICVGRKATSP